MVVRTEIIHGRRWWPGVQPQASGLEIAFSHRYLILFNPNVLCIHCYFIRLSLTSSHQYSVTFNFENKGDPPCKSITKKIQVFKCKGCAAVFLFPPCSVLRNPIPIPSSPGARFCRIPLSPPSEAHFGAGLHSPLSKLLSHFPMWILSSIVSGIFFAILVPVFFEVNASPIGSSVASCASPLSHFSGRGQPLFPRMTIGYGYLSNTVSCIILVTVQIVDRSIFMYT